MASRLHIAEPSIDHLEAAEDALRGAQLDQPAQSREAAGLHIAAAWVGEQDGSIDGLGERRLELAFARVLAREGSDLADPMELSALDYARTILVDVRSEEHTSELQSLMRISYAVFCLKKKNKNNNKTHLQ